MRGDELQTFKSISSPNRENLAENLTVFRRKKRETPVNGHGKTQILTTNLQSGGPGANWFLGRTPEIGKICFWSCCPTDYRTFHLCHDTSTPEEINKPGSLGERRV